MDDITQGPSDAQEFGPATTVIELPVSGPRGVRLRMEIEAAPLDELLPILRQLPAQGRDTTLKPVNGEDPLAVTERFVRDYDEQARQIVSRWVLRPQIAFEGPIPGRIEWRHVHLMNRVALVNAITRFSQTGEAAERLATFPDELPGGEGGGGGAGGGRADADPAAPAAAEAAGAQR